MIRVYTNVLCYITGVTGKMSTETAHDDDNFGTESSQKVILGLQMGKLMDLIVKLGNKFQFIYVHAGMPREISRILECKFSWRSFRSRRRNYHVVSLCEIEKHWEIQMPI